MKIMYIGKDDMLLDKIRNIFEQERFDYIHYRDPGKALNNIREIDPDALFFIEDHYGNKGATVRKVLSNTTIPTKCACLFFSKSFNNTKEETFYFLNTSLNNNKNIDFLNNAVRKKSENKNDTQLMITHPVTPGFITGKIQKIENNIIEFLPDFPDSSASIVENTRITTCTMKLNDQFFSFPADLIYNGATMKFLLDKKTMKKIDKKA